MTRDPDSMDRLFHALANRTRREILDVLKAEPGISVGALSAHFDVSRVAVIKHLRVLEAAHLVLSETEGRRRLLYFNAVPIQTVYDRWTTEYSAMWASRMTALKYRIESAET